MGVKLEEKHRPPFFIVEISLDEPIVPDELKGLKAPKAPHGSIVLLTGRAPIWLYAYLVHEYIHVAKAVAIYDPKIPGYVVVASHTPEHTPGNIIAQDKVGS